MTKKMWNRNYIIIIIGQGISLFANNILYFAASLFILDLTASGTIYGSVTAFSKMPLLLLLPIGGVVTDRYNKKKILIATDFCTAVLVGLFGLGIVYASSLWCIILLLMSLTVIEGFYTPCTQAMIPAIQTKENLVRANAIVNQIAIVANIIGPVLGSVIYGFAGIRWILLVSLISFLASAVLEFFIRWPVQEGQKAAGSDMGGSGFFGEIKEGFSFVKENKKIRRAVPLTAVLNLTLTPVFTVGMAFMIKIGFQYSGEVYGIASTCVILASLLGTFLAGVMGEKLNRSFVYRATLGSCLCLIPISIGYWCQLPRTVMLLLIVGMFMVEQLLLNMYSVYAVAFIQKQTPQQNMGKVMSMVVMISICTESIERVIYGVAIDYISAAALVAVTVLAAAVVVVYFWRKIEVFGE